MYTNICLKGTVNIITDKLKQNMVHTVLKEIKKPFPINLKSELVSVKIKIY